MQGAFPSELSSLPFSFLCRTFFSGMALRDGSDAVLLNVIPPSRSVFVCCFRYPGTLGGGRRPFGTDRHKLEKFAMQAITYETNASHLSSNRHFPVCEGFPCFAVKREEGARVVTQRPLRRKIPEGASHVILWWRLALLIDWLGTSASAKNSK